MASHKAKMISYGFSHNKMKGPGFSHKNNDKLWLLTQRKMNELKGSIFL